MIKRGTTSLEGPEVLVQLAAGTGRSLRAQVEDGLRVAVRSGRLTPGARMPASRVLAHDLGVSRRLVVEAYGQLVAEGYLAGRPGSGTYVRAVGPAPEAPAPRRTPARVQPAGALRYDFFPGHPDLAGFPRADWMRSQREALRDAPDRALGYPDPAGSPALRSALTTYLRRVRGVVADPDRVVVCGGATQALNLLATALSSPRIAVEDPYLPEHRLVLHHAGAEVVPVPVDEHGIDLDALERAGVEVALVTPAHQCPTGAVLHPLRRAGLIDWAADGHLVIEDDYDAEYRFDGAPLSALQGLAPERVIYLGSASKSLAPALRLAWLVLPAPLVPAVVRAKRLADSGSPTLEQLALARFIETGRLDRHLRSARRRYRARREALDDALRTHLPGSALTGAAAGLHAVAHLPHPFEASALAAAARERSVGVYPLGWGYAQPRDTGRRLVLGYAALPEPAIAAGVRRLAAAFDAVSPRTPRAAG